MMLEVKCEAGNFYHIVLSYGALLIIIYYIFAHTTNPQLLVVLFTP